MHPASVNRPNVSFRHDYLKIIYKSSKLKSLKLFLALLVFGGLSSCNKKADFISELPNPISGLTETPFLSSYQNGKLILSWSEVIQDTISELRFVSFDGTSFSTPKTVARGSNWFVNWADCPSVISVGKDPEYLIAHWLQKSAEGIYDYDIRISISEDDGESWSDSFILHDDNIDAEHGFVTMKPFSENKVFITWLDGRNTKANGKKGFNPKMTLRSAVLNMDGTKDYDIEIDSMVCDCCQTDVAIVNKSPLVVYRDRSNGEIRDIAYSLLSDHKASAPKILNDDSWYIPGCPVNGPRISAFGGISAIVWYTESNQEPNVSAIFLNSSGERISDLIKINSGNTMGRVDIEMINNVSAIVCWMENTGTEATIFSRIISIDGKKGEAIEIGKNSQARSSGFPVISKFEDKILFAYTLVDGDHSSIKTKILNLKDFDY